MCRYCKCFTCRIKVDILLSSITALCDIENIPALSKEFTDCLGLVMLTSLNVYNMALVDTLMGFATETSNEMSSVALSDTGLLQFENWVAQNRNHCVHSLFPYLIYWGLTCFSTWSLRRPILWRCSSSMHWLRCIAWNNWQLILREILLSTSLCGNTMFSSDWTTLIYKR